MRWKLAKRKSFKIDNLSFKTSLYKNKWKHKNAILVLFDKAKSKIMLHLEEKFYTFKMISLVTKSNIVFQLNVIGG